MERGFRAIIVYKFTKAIVQLAAAVTVIFLRVRIANAIADHASAAWSLWLARLLTPAHERLIAVALVGDALLSAFEGWSLRRGFHWAPWMVAAIVAALLPMEAIEFARRPDPLRLLVMAVNLAIAIYLVRRAQRRMTNGGRASTEATSSAP